MFPTGEFIMVQCEFYQGFERGDKYVTDKYSNAEFLIVGDFNCKAGEG